MEIVVQFTNADESCSCWLIGYRRFWRYALLLAAGIGPMLAAHGQSIRVHGKDAMPEPDTGALSIQINDDRLTLAAAKVPQVYLYGVIDTDAPHRFEALVKSRKIPAGSDIYLDSTAGNRNAGIALGRLFRAGAMVTHLGAPRRKLRTGSMPKASSCVDACTYAYLGGLYRWLPSGNDRIGLRPIAAVDAKAAGTNPEPLAPDETASYLKDIGIRLDVLMPALTTSRDDIVWLTSEQIASAGLANNGFLPLTASYQLSSGAPYLVLDQIVRNGENKFTLLCRPDGLTLTAYYTVGAMHARQMVARGTRSYFEIDHQELLPQQREGATVVDQAMVFSRPLALTELERLVSARSLGAWLSDRNGAVRYGFTIGPAAVKNSLRDYYTHCAQFEQRPSSPKP